MRASRLLEILLLLQNRGRMTSVQLARELEVAPRTILRDVDAMTEAGLPIIVFQGNRGGIELGFNYRTRLTGLDRDEAEALGIILGTPAPMLEALGLATAGKRARSKLIESLPDTVRAHAARAQATFPQSPPPPPPLDPRIPAMADAVRGRNIVRLRARSRDPLLIHPCQLGLEGEIWCVTSALAPDAPVPLSAWGDINISARTFPAA